MRGFDVRRGGSGLVGEGLLIGRARVGPDSQPTTEAQTAPELGPGDVAAALGIDEHLGIHELDGGHRSLKLPRGHNVERDASYSASAAG
jgi:hypothetical protein